MGTWPTHKEGQVLWCEGWLCRWPANEDSQVLGCGVKNGNAACIRGWPGVGHGMRDELMEHAGQ